MVGSTYEDLEQRVLDLTRKLDDLREENMELTQTDSLYQTLLNEAEIALLVVGAEEPIRGHIVLANNSAAKMHGYTLEELYSLRLHDLDAPEEVEHLDERMETLLAGHSMRFEMDHRKKDGTIFPVEAHARLIELPKTKKLEGGKYVVISDRDISKRRRAEQRADYGKQVLREHIHKQEEVFSQVIEVVGRVQEKRDIYTVGHQKRVACLAYELARRIGLSKKESRGIFFAGCVHDIGKIGVPTEYLSRPSLAPFELGQLKYHSEMGYDILKGIDFEWPIAEMVLQHHEDFNGKGYPAGLAEEDILIGARVLRVADTIEAMAADRPYRAALGLEKALDTIDEGSGVIFDPIVVEACFTLFSEGYNLFDSLNVNSCPL